MNRTMRLCSPLLIPIPKLDSNSTIRAGQRQVLVSLHNTSTMALSVSNLFSIPNGICIHDQKLSSSFHYQLPKHSIFPSPSTINCQNPNLHSLSVLSYNKSGAQGSAISIEETERAKYKWVRKDANFSEEQKRAVSQIPPKMANRCKALMKQIICFSVENGSFPLMLAAWVKNTKPQRADWLSVLKELDRLNNPLYFEVAEYALTEESFEANIRDYTKIIHFHAKQNNLKEAENTLLAMKNRGFFCDQVTLTALVHMYSKAGNLKQAEDTFEEMKLLGVQLDKRSYGSIIMAYIRAEMFEKSECLLKEMVFQEIYAGREVYKALLRAYSMNGDSKGAQRIFDAIQMAGIVPDVKICGLLINAYLVSGQTCEARVAFENMRRAGVEPNDKCVALVVAAYAKESRLKEALDLLMELEKESFVVGKECSEVLAKWFSKLGVVEEVELALRDISVMIPQSTM